MVKVLTGSVASIIHFIADDAKKRFKNLRIRYTRDKNKVTKRRNQGVDTRCQKRNFRVIPIPWLVGFTRNPAAAK